MKMLDDVYTIVEGLSEDGENMLETFGNDLDIVQAQVLKNYKKVWTLVDVGKKDLIAITGYHLCNRVNYVITEEEWKSEDEEYIW